MKDGISIKANLNSINSKGGRYPLYLMFTQFIAIFMGNWSIISILVETFDLPVSFISLNAVAFIACLIMYFLFRGKAYGIWKILSLLLVYAFFLSKRWKQFENGFYIFENYAINKINDYYEVNIIKYVADYSRMYEDVTLVIIAIMIPIIALLTMSMLRGWMINLCVVIMIIPVAANFLVGLVPSGVYLITLMIVLLFMLKLQGPRFHSMQKAERINAERVNTNVAILLCAISLGIMAIIRLLFAPEDYYKVTYIPEKKEELQTFLTELNFDDISNQFSDWKITVEKDKSYGGLRGGLLGRVGEVRYTGQEHLHLRMPKEAIGKGMYLKGYVGLEYMGDRWTEASQEVRNKYEDLLKKIPNGDIRPVNQIPWLLKSISILDNSREYNKGLTLPEGLYGFKEGKILIEYINANRDFIYAPYFTDFNKRDDMEYRDDLYAKPVRRKNTYELMFYYNLLIEDNYGSSWYPNLNLRDSNYIKFEKMYQDYVYDVYTKLPERGLEQLKNDFSMSYDRNDASSLLERIKYVQYYLHNSTEYTLSPGLLPQGEDFVEYFLYENKLGYCAHYASAATLILRAMGIPARYVEGYALGNIPESNNLGQQDVRTYSNSNYMDQKVEYGEYIVSDYNAHAWVEVYINGCGWVPIEFTPSSAVQGTIEAMEDMLLLQDEIEDASSLTPTLTITPDPTAAPEPTDILEPTDLPRETDRQIEHEAMKQLDDKASNLLSVASILAVFLLGLIIVLVSRIIIRRKNLNSAYGNYNKKALYLYSDIEKVFILLNLISKDKISLEDAAEADQIEGQYAYINESDLLSCIEIARKARYGREGISLTELQQVEKFYRELWSKLKSNLSIGRRLILNIGMLF